LAWAAPAKIEALHMKPFILPLPLLLLLIASASHAATRTNAISLKNLQQKAAAAIQIKSPVRPVGKQQATTAKTIATSLTAQSTLPATADTQTVASFAYPNPLGDNWSYTNSNSPGSTPTAVRPDSTFDVKLPAEIGDIIRYEFSGRVNTPSTTGLVLSVWSIAGSSPRDWSSNAIGLQAVNGFATVPAANASANPALSLNSSVTNTVEASDIDTNGMVTLRMYAANTAGSGAQKSLFLNYQGNGIINQARAINFKSNTSANQPKVYTAYPNTQYQSNFAFTTNNQSYGIPVPLNPSGGFDLIIPAKSLDIINYHLHGAANAATNLDFSVWSVGGALTRSWTDSEFLITNNSGIAIIGTGNGKAIDATVANRVLPTDLDSNGNVTLRVYVANITGSGLQHHTFLGKDNSGNPSYAAASNYGNAESYVLTDSQHWEGKPGISFNSEQEPSVWVDSNGLINMLYSGGTSNHTGWATASNPMGPWTKYANNPVIGGGALTQNDAMRNTVMYQNGLLYVYFAQEDANLYVASGTDPAHLTLNPSPIFSAQGSIKTLENSAVVLGPNATYYLFFEGLYNSTGLWQLGVATSSSPLGPFTLVPGSFPLTSLQVATGSATDGPWVEWTGSKFRMVYHAAAYANNNVPSQIYTAESTDGINWQWPSVNIDGLPTPIRTPYLELNHNQAADPFILKYQGNVYLYHTEQDGNVVGGGGIVVNDPTLLFNAIDY
jgi:hypothetical protein